MRLGMHSRSLGGYRDNACGTWEGQRVQADVKHPAVD